MSAHEDPNRAFARSVRGRVASQRSASDANPPATGSHTFPSVPHEPLGNSARHTRGGDRPSSGAHAGRGARAVASTDKEDQAEPPPVSRSRGALPGKSSGPRAAGIPDKERKLAAEQQAHELAELHQQVHDTTDDNGVISIDAFHNLVQPIADRGIGSETMTPVLQELRLVLAERPRPMVEPVCAASRSPDYRRRPNRRARGRRSPAGRDRGRSGAPGRVTAGGRTKGLMAAAHWWRCPRTRRCVPEGGRGALRSARSLVAVLRRHRRASPPPAGAFLPRVRGLPWRPRHERAPLRV